MLKTTIGIALFTNLLGAVTTQATVVPTNTKEINISVSSRSGHLLDWSRTNQRIQMVMIESPEEAIEKITFSIPGCKKESCGTDSSLMMINSRKGRTSGVAAMRVVTVGKRGVKSVYRVRVTIVKAEVPRGQTETEFVPNQR
jgi:hypothetical protein